MTKQLFLAGISSAAYPMLKTKSLPLLVWSCYKEAKKQNMKYFAVQFFGECWASNSPISYQKYGKTATCWSGVGFQNTNYVYKVVR